MIPTWINDPYVGAFRRTLAACRKSARWVGGVPFSRSTGDQVPLPPAKLQASLGFVVQQETDRLGEVLEAFIPGFTLTIGARNLKAVGPETALGGFTAMNDGRELLHAARLLESGPTIKLRACAPPAFELSLCR